MSGVWEVHSYHVNVSKGDCAIHLLVQLNTADGKGAIQAAVLIDGGTNVNKIPGTEDIGLTDSRPIRRMVKWIDSRNDLYTFEQPNSPGHLTFDTIIITHWDEDHYAGFMRTLVFDLQAKPNQATYLQWSNDTPPKPLTMMYAPNQDRGTKLNGLQNTGLFSLIKVGTEQYIQTKFLKSKPQQTLFAKFRCVDLNVKSLDYYAVLGVNFFTNKRLPNPPASFAMNPDTLAQKNPPLQVGQPGMYCVGVYRKTFTAEPKKPVIAARNAIEIIYDSGVTMTNQVSIACMIIWPKTGAIPCRISHYFAGDMEESVETNIVSWLRQNKITDLRSMKLSHHGSHSSTPVVMAQQVFPSNIVVSNPYNMYIHPGWELLVLLGLWRTQAPFANRLPFLWALKYPFYLMKDSNGAYNKVKLVYSKGNSPPNLNTESFDHPFGIGKAWVNYVNAINKKLLINGVKNKRNEYSGYVSVQKAGKPVNQYLLDLVLTRWQNYASPDPSSNPAAHSSLMMPELATTGTSNLLECVVIVSRNDADSDGIVRLKKYQDTQLVTKAVASSSKTSKKGKTDVLATQSGIAVNGTVSGASSLGSGFGTTGPSIVKKGSSMLKNEPSIMKNEPSILQAAETQDLGLMNTITVADDAFGSPAPTNPDEMDSAMLTEDDDTNGVAMAVPPEAAPALPDSSSKAQTQTTMLALSSTVDSTASTNWYLYSSNIPSASIVATGVTTSSFAQTSSTNPWDYFISTLHCSMITFTSLPTGTSAPVYTGDEWMSWMIDCVNVQQMTIDGDLATGQIEGIAMSLQLQPPGTTTSSDPSKPTLVFSTDVDVLSNTFYPSTPPTAGLREGSTSIVLGLSNQPTPATPGTPATITLADLINFTGSLELLDEPVISQIFASFSLTLPNSTSNSRGCRNAIWFEPQTSYKTTTRLQFVLSDAARENLNSYLSFLKFASINSASIICRRTSTWDANDQKAIVHSKSKLIVLAEFTIASTTPEPIVVDAAIELEVGRVSLIVTLQAKTTSVLADIITWLKGALELQDSDFSFKNWIGKSNSSSNLSSFEFDFRRVTIEVNTDPNTGAASFGSFALDMELLVNCGSQPALFLMTYIYAAGGGGSLEADFWQQPPMNVHDPGLLLLPDYESYAYFEPLSSNPPKWPKPIDISLIGGFDSSTPAEVASTSQFPTLLTQARLLIGPNGVAFTGKLQAKEAKQANQKPAAIVPVVSLDEVDLAVSYGAGGFSASLMAHVLLEPPPNATFATPAQFTAFIGYSNKVWTLEASVANLYASSLFQFFESDVQQAITPIIQSIEIASMDMTYQYDSAGAVASFVMGADLLIGGLDLVLTYNRPGDGTWTFGATATFDSNTKSSTTIGAILTDLTGSSEIDLPYFILNTDVELRNDQDSISLALARTEINTQPGLFFNFDIDLKLSDELPALKFQYIQFCVNENAATAQPKRVFMAVMDSLPEIDIPLIGNISQPFDEAVLIWVQPPSQTTPPPESPTSSTQATGLTKADVEYINQEITNLKLPLKQLVYKAVKSPLAETDVVINSGLHFMIMLKDNNGQSMVALDYPIGGSQQPEMSQILSVEPHSANTEVVVSRPSANPSTSGSTPKRTWNKKHVRTDADPPTPTPPATAGGSGMAAYQKSFGPLMVKNIGLKYSSSVLSIKVDATITIGPIAFEIIGFCLNLDFTGGFGLSHLPTPSFNFDGLGAAFDRPPLTIMGELLKVYQNGLSGYAGALDLGFDPWEFAAAGFYGDKTDGSGKSYTTTFVYAVLNGPLITLEFATITGVTAGFGYNTNLRLPSAKDIPSYPLIHPPGGSNITPSNALDNLLGTPVGGPNAWFFPQDGCFWIAAGLSVSAFELLEVTAVAVVEWSPSVKLGLYGLATASIPSSVGENQDGATFAVVQLGIAATLDFAAGTLKIDGQLTPASYILDPKCHLSGGFALYSWFGDQNDASDLKGDWVFTIGGYHTQFVVPPQYPNPPRLAISWQYDDSISISGQAYFAITPKVCMGGGRLDLTLTLGPLSAFLDAYIDFLINFKPFHFTADGGISVGVRYTMDLWLVTLHINVEIGAQLYIEGPPINGHVHVNFWVFGFDINFGPSSLGYNALSLQDFITLVCKAEQNTDAAPASVVTAKTAITGPTAAKATVADNPSAVHVFSVENGLIPSGPTDSDPNADTWQIRAKHFSFMISCKFAVSDITIQTLKADGTTVTNKKDVPGTGVPINAKPMYQNNISSTLTVGICATESGSPSVKARAGAAAPSDGPPPWTNATGITKSLPTGLWGPYDQGSDPSYNPNNNDLLNGTAEGTVSLLAGVVIQHPDPMLSPDTMPAFNFEERSVENVPPLSAPHWYFPAFNADQPNFAPAQPIATDPTNPDPTKRNQWAQVANAWENPRIPKDKNGNPAGTQLAQAWQAIALVSMGWDKAKVDPQTAVNQKKPPVDLLTGGCPVQLVDDIYNYYLWAPNVNVVPAPAVAQPKAKPAPKPAPTSKSSMLASRQNPSVRRMKAKSVA